MKRPFAAVIGLTLTLSGLCPAARAQSDFSGLWVLDESHRNRDVYGEVRLVRQSDDRIEMTILDFSERLAILPWIFRVDRWGPRRGRDLVNVPRTIARWSGDQLVLAKSTFSGAGEFVWVWSSTDGGLSQRATRRNWNADFTRHPAEGLEIRFHGASLDDFDRMASSLRSGIRSTGEEIEIRVRLSADASALLVECPEQDCRIIQLDSGVRTGSRPLPQGEVGVVAIGSEALVEGVP